MRVVVFGRAVLRSISISPYLVISPDAMYQILFGKRLQGSIKGHVVSSLGQLFKDLRGSSGWREPERIDSTPVRTGSGAGRLHEANRRVFCQFCPQRDYSIRLSPMPETELSDQRNTRKFSQKIGPGVRRYLSCGARVTAEIRVIRRSSGGSL